MYENNISKESAMGNWALELKLNKPLPMAGKQNLAPLIPTLIL